METPSGEQTKKTCAALLDLAILTADQNDLPPAFQEQWVALRRTRNIVAAISALDFDLLLDRHVDSINLHANDLLHALEPLTDLVGHNDAEVTDFDDALKEFDTTAKIMLAELVPLIAQMKIYATRS